MAPGGTGEETGCDLTLLTLKNGETIIVGESLFSLLQACFGSGSVEGRITINLELWVGEIWNGESRGRRLVSSAADSSERLPVFGGLTQGRVAVRGWEGSTLGYCNSEMLETLRQISVFDPH